MPALLVMFIIQLVRLLLDGRSNPATDATALNHQAEESASSGNYPLAEKKLLALVNMAERQDGRDGMAVAVYLRRLARLKFEQGDNAAAESLLQRVLTIQEKNLSPITNPAHRENANDAPTIHSAAIIPSTTRRNLPAKRSPRITEPPASS